MSNALTTASQKAKSFWDTKEGTTGMVIGLGIFGLLGYGAYKIMPYLANLMENTFYTILFGALSVALFYALVIDGTLRSRLWISYKLMMRALTYSIIKYDPIGILREIQKKAKERIKLVDESRATVKGQIGQIDNSISSFQNDQRKITRELEFMRQNQRAPQEIQNHLARLGKLGEAEKRLTASRTQVDGFYNQLSRAFNALVTIDGNIDFEISIMEREYKAVTASHTAWKAVKAAFKGNDEIDMLREDTLAFLAEDYGNKLGEIESFMDDSKKFIDGVDLQQAMQADDGLKMLEALNACDITVDKSKNQLSMSQPDVMIPNLSGVKTAEYTYIKK